VALQFAQPGSTCSPTRRCGVAVVTIHLVCGGFIDRHTGSVEIRLVTRVDDITAAGHLFDAPPEPAASHRFVADDRHHLLVAYADDGTPAGMVTGVEMTHPDKGTEMFLYELGVDEAYQGQGVGTALVEALAEVARTRGCFGMWVITDEGNAAALATYRRAGGVSEDRQVVLAWTFDG
jgi:ribosomal protein S18 acetylase RimI-like enzyme